MRFLNMQWTDRIRQVKILLVLIAVIIATGSLVVSHLLTRDLEREELRKMEVWAEAMRSLNNADENTDIALVFKVIDNNTTIPVVVLNENGVATTSRNIKLPKQALPDSIPYLTEYGRHLRAAGNSIRIALNEEESTDYIDVCFADSLMLRRLALWPYVQLGIVLIFVVIAIFALLTSKRAEQNKVWVGLSKETAHQLGTPISSLMAWTEILKEQYPDDELLPEMDNDVKRLQLIADRFSKIGSLPEPIDTSLNELLQHVVDYMNRRTSHRVMMQIEQPDHEVRVKLNGSLFEWVIENLCKNAVDAMGENGGSITLHVEEQPQRVIIDVSDTGKGIKKKDLANVFRPGFTTKQRGWGLGLSLAKRIVEEYHHGRIYVLRSELGQGTTFRIELRS